MKFDERITKLKNETTVNPFAMQKTIKELADCILFLKDRFMELEERENSFIDSQHKFNETIKSALDAIKLPDVQDHSAEIKLLTEVCKENRQYLIEHHKKIEENSNRIITLFKEMPKLSVPDNMFERGRDKLMEYLETHEEFLVKEFAEETQTPYSSMTLVIMLKLMKDGIVKKKDKKIGCAQVWQSLIYKGESQKSDLKQ